MAVLVDTGGARQAVCVRLLHTIPVHHVLRARAQLGLPDRGALVRPPTKALLASDGFPASCVQILNRSVEIILSFVA